jgi:protein deglycase
MKRVLLLLSPGFEEIEAISPLDLLRRAGIQVISASVGKELRVEGSHGISIIADAMLEDCLSETYDMLILPGGPGVGMLRKESRVLKLVRESFALGVPLAAICAAPLILADAGVVQDFRITSFPGVEAELQAGIREYSESRVVVDGKVITSRGAGTAEEFSLAIIEYLLDKAAVEAIRKGIVARRADWG